MYFDVAVVHDEILSQKVLERGSIDDVELAVPFESVNHAVDALLELAPILLVFLHFGLCAREILVELLQVVVVVNLFELVLLGDLAEVLQNLLAELTRLFRQLLLHLEQVPVASDATQHVVEESVEFVAQSVSYEDHVIPERDLVFGEVAADLVLNHALSVLDVLQTFFDLFLERRLEVELVHRVERHHWVEEMVSVEAFGADLLLAFETKQNVVLVMQLTYVGKIREFSG